MNVCISYLIAPWGYNGTLDSPIVGGTAALFGIIGILIITKKVFKTKKYKFHLFWAFINVVLVMSSAYFLMET